MKVYIDPSAEWPRNGGFVAVSGKPLGPQLDTARIGDNIWRSRIENRVLIAYYKWRDHDDHSVLVTDAHGTEWLIPIKSLRLLAVWRKGGQIYFDDNPALANRAPVGASPRNAPPVSLRTTRKITLKKS